MAADASTRERSMVETRINKLTYEDYLKTSDDERWELLDGELLMVPGPNTAHQTVTGNLFIRLSIFVKERGLGRVFVAPFDVILSLHNVVQPDVLFVADNQRSILTDANVKGAPALVIEVMSPSTSARDHAVKRNIYARNGVGEYWLADPDTKTVSVMVLEGDEFREVGAYGLGDVLISPAMPGLDLDVQDIFEDS